MAQSDPAGPAGPPPGQDVDRLDGSAAGGVLAEVFGADITPAHHTCAGCLATTTVAEHHVHARSAGTVLRCPHCGDVAVTVVTAPRHVTLTVRGALRLPR
jgi:predicted RNA-binding Zn-ribbon protein involved in translation (DUF1610 family)